MVHNTLHKLNLEKIIYYMAYINYDEKNTLIF